jgi:hypothetical protein
MSYLSAFELGSAHMKPFRRISKCVSYPWQCGDNQIRFVDNFYWRHVWMSMDVVVVFQNTASIIENEISDKRKCRRLFGAYLNKYERFDLDWRYLSKTWRMFGLRDPHLDIKWLAMYHMTMTFSCFKGNCLSSIWFNPKWNYLSHLHGSNFRELQLWSNFSIR